MSWVQGKTGREVVVKNGDTERAIKRFIKKSKEWTDDRMSYFQTNSELRRISRAAAVRRARVAAREQE